MRTLLNLLAMLGYVIAYVIGLVLPVTLYSIFIKHSNVSDGWTVPLLAFGLVTGAGVASFYHHTILRR